MERKPAQNNIVIKAPNQISSNTSNQQPPLDKTKSFKQKKKITKGTRGYGLKQIARMTLGSGDM
jgi:hypothetical protein